MAAPRRGGTEFVPSAPCPKRGTGFDARTGKANRGPILVDSAVLIGALLALTVALGF